MRDLCGPVYQINEKHQDQEHRDALLHWKKYYYKMLSQNVITKYYYKMLYYDKYMMFVKINQIIIIFLK